MNIVLIGYRASGKSTIGRILSEKLSLKFVDIDLDIMAKYDNKSVADIWKEFGEPSYRETECDVTEEACRRQGQIIALGGGTPMQSRAFDALASASNTTRFFLDAPAEVLFERSQVDAANRANRPSFGSGGGLQEIEKMLAIRKPTYQRLADHTIDVAEFSFTDAADEIERIIVGADRN